MNISGGKKDPETLRKEAICEALESLLEKEGSQQFPMPVAKESSDSEEKADGKSKSRVTGSRGPRGKDGRGVNISNRGQQRKIGKEGGNK